jgi:hypothetical protein
MSAALATLARHRLHSLCPYFAMFPETFVRDQLERYTSEGDLVFDPFSGRGTTVLESLLMGRDALATDINPVAFCISAAKAQLPSLSRSLTEIDRLAGSFERCNRSLIEQQAMELPAFFKRAFYHSTLEQLLFLRGCLKWKTDKTHRFIAALTLGSLHGEMDKSSSYFSNQMPRSISTKPAYSLKYWRDNDLWPKKRNVFELLRERAEFRFRSEPPVRRGTVKLGDARRSADFFRAAIGRVKAVITSPPYLDVTRYEEDQWLRLWFLGGLPEPTYGAISRDDRHCSEPKYWQFLADVWKGFQPMLAKKAVLVCRIGAKGLDLEALSLGLRQSLRAASVRFRAIEGPTVTRIHKRQTDYFRPGSKGCLYEADFVFQLCTQ